MKLEKLINTYNGSAKTLLKAGLKSPNAFEKTLDRLDELADRFYDLIEKRAPYLLEEDTTPTSLQAEVGSDSLGSNTLAASSLSAALIQGEHYSIAVAEAVSVAVADGGDELTFVSTFTGVPGADFSLTKTKTFSGKNYDAAMEAVVAVDFDFLDFDHVDILKTQNGKVGRWRADIEEGNVAKVEVDLVAKGENTAIWTEMDALAISDVLSTTSISADLYIA